MMSELNQGETAVLQRKQVIHNVFLHSHEVVGSLIKQLFSVSSTLTITTLTIWKFICHKAESWSLRAETFWTSLREQEKQLKDTFVVERLSRLSHCLNQKYKKLINKVTNTVTQQEQFE